MASAQSLWGSKRDEPAVGDGPGGHRPEEHPMVAALSAAHWPRPTHTLGMHWGMQRTQTLALLCAPACKAIAPAAGWRNRWKACHQHTSAEQPLAIRKA